MAVAEVGLVVAVLASAAMVVAVAGELAVEVTAPEVWGKGVGAGVAMALVTGAALAMVPLVVEDLVVAASMGMWGEELAEVWALLGSVVVVLATVWGSAVAVLLGEVEAETAQEDLERAVVGGAAMAREQGMVAMVVVIIAAGEAMVAVAVVAVAVADAVVAVGISSVAMGAICVVVAMSYSLTIPSAHKQ